MTRPHIRAVGEGPGFWAVFARGLAEVRGRGTLVADAHLVALMRQYGVETIWTRDRDFRKFDAVKARDPFR